MVRTEEKKAMHDIHPNAGTILVTGENVWSSGTAARRRLNPSKLCSIGFPDGLHLALAHIGVVNCFTSFCFCGGRKALRYLPSFALPVCHTVSPVTSLRRQIESHFCSASSMHLKFRQRVLISMVSPVTVRQIPVARDLACAHGLWVLVMDSTCSQDGQYLFIRSSVPRRRNLGK